MMDIINEFLTATYKFPDNIAVSASPRETTYTELRVLVEKIAANIDKRHAEPRVLLCMPRNSEAYAAILATLAVGGYFCPVNIELPMQRINDIFQIFKPHIVIADTDWFKLNFANDLNSLLLDPKNIELGRYDLSEMKFNRIGYVIFTSGSTGRPKGVIIPRTAISHFTQQFSRCVKITPHDRWAQFSNLGFDLSLVDIFVTLTSGSTLVPVIRPHERTFPALFIRDRSITVWHSVPSVIDLMEKSGQVVSDNLNTLRLATFCGEPLRHQHLTTLFRAKKSLKICNTYGPTETTMFCTTQLLTYQNYKQYCRETAAIGIPMNGWRIELIGGTSPNEGEITINGDHIGLGYLTDNVQINSGYRKFRDETDKNSSKLTYFTGDWAERIEGNLYFRHRIDRQVKINGNRLELGEVEHHLRDATGKHCCIILTEKGLIGIIETETEIKEKVIIEELRTVLPTFAIPKALVRIAKLPRNANDKTDIAEVKLKALELLQKGGIDNDS